MHADLTALSAAVAATGRWKPRPGQCVSLDGHRWWLCGSQWRVESGESASPATVVRLLAAGPDLTDVVTALSLLLGTDIAVTRCNDGWRAVYGAAVHWSAAPGECVAKCWLAAHGGFSHDRP